MQKLYKNQNLNGDFEKQDYTIFLDKKIHILGAGGIGMSAITNALLDFTTNITIEDTSHNKRFQQLFARGAKLKKNHEIPDIVIYSSAIPNSILTSFSNSILLHRSDALAFLSHNKKLILVAGSHGKSTTTYFLVRLFQEYSISCSFIIGAESDELIRNGLFDTKSEFIIAEGDESDGTLEKYSPYLFLINYISDDHMDYFTNFQSIKKLFLKVVKKSKVVYSYDKNPRFIDNEITYGYKNTANYKIIKDSFEKTEVLYNNGCFDIQHSIWGKQNGINALAAIIAFQYFFPYPLIEIAKKIASCNHLKRRMELVSQIKDVRFFDDYANHHDSLVYLNNTLKSIRTNKNIAIFQGVRWSRNKNFTIEFKQQLKKIDIVFIYNLHYRPGEDKVDYRPADIIDKNICFVSDKGLLFEVILCLINKKDIVITIGGTLSDFAKELSNNYYKKIMEL